MTIDDRELERVARELGRPAGDRLDVERVARGVVARLRTAGEADRASAADPRPALRWLATAAAAALLVAGSVVTLRHAPPTGLTVATTATGLYDLSSDELSEVLDSLSLHAPVSSQFTVGLDDLDADQLRDLLALMEG